jgi:glutamine cyclotransferase
MVPRGVRPVPLRGLRLHLAWVALAATGMTCQGSAATQDYTVVARFPHDTTAFTQGLVYSQGELYESTGRLGHSQLRRVELTTGRVLAATELAADRFGEGLTMLDGRLYQLTWQSGVGYVYRADNLNLVDSFNFTGEGWGLTTDGNTLIMSDGSATLRFLDARSFAAVREVVVRDDGLPLTQINELEYVQGQLYANVYQSDRIVQIDPTSGAVLRWFDLAGLLPDSERSPTTDVMNGIAFDEEGGHFLVTGKLWPVLFELSLRRPDEVDSATPANAAR